MKLLHDWSNFDLPKLMPVEHISLMLHLVYLSLIHARIQANKLLVMAQPTRNLRTPASTAMNKGGSYRRRPLPSFPDPPLFPPYPLPLSMPALQAMARSSKYRDITTVNTLIIPATATSLAKIAGVLCFIAIRD